MMASTFRDMTDLCCMAGIRGPLHTMDRNPEGRPSIRDLALAQLRRDELRSRRAQALELSVKLLSAWTTATNEGRHDDAQRAKVALQTALEVAERCRR